MPDKKKSVNKAILGLVIGAAVGSVIGVSVAPDKGSKTRKKLKKGTVGFLKILPNKKKQSRGNLDSGEL